MDGLDLLEDFGDGEGRETIYINDITEARNHEIFNLKRGEKQINVLHLNIRSINKNFDEFLVFLEMIGKSQIDLIFLSETWKVDNEDIYNISGFNLIYSEGNYNQNDGIIAYIKEEYSYTHEIVRVSENSFILIKVNMCNVYWNCIGVYRPPATDVNQFLLDLNEICNYRNNEKVIYVGDINIDLLAQDNITHEYLNLMGSKGFCCCLEKPTRVTNVSSSCLDHFFYRSYTNLKTSYETAIIKTYISDHFASVLSVKYPYLEPNDSKSVNDIDKSHANKTDINKLKEFLKKETWSDLYHISCPELLSNYFVNTLNAYINNSKYLINKNCKVKKKKPWITVGLINSIKHRDKLRRNLNFNNHIEVHRYKTYRNHLTNLIKKTRENYYKQLLDKANKDQKAIWDVFKKITGVSTRTKNKISLNVDGITVTDDNKLANDFNNHFINIGIEMQTKITKHSEITQSKYDTVQHNPATMFLQPVTEEEVMREIGTLKSNCATGPDNISSRVIKYCKEQLCKPLVHLINIIFQSGKFPSNLKTSIVTPVYKAKAHNDIGNYRPISIISNIAKIVEKCIKSRLLSFFQKHKILNQQQFGFTQNKSTSDAIYEVLDMITNSVNKDEKTSAVFVDLAKAFDTVPHGRLLTKLERYGIRGNAYNLFSSYLSDRVQTVKIDNTYSSPRTVRIGIPQGTVLGPICFLIYVNDVFDLDIEGRIISYADDTVMIFRGDSNESVRDMMERGLTQLKTWLEINLLSLNIDKTKYIYFTLTADPSIQQTIQIHDFNCKQKINCLCSSVSKVSNIRYLGIIIDENLRWNEHIIHINNKLRKILPKFYQIRNITNSEIKKTLYFALVESNIRYGITAWGSAYDKAIYPLQILQKTLIKVLYMKSKFFQSEQLFRETELMTIRNLYYFEILTFVHRHNSRFETITPSYNTRVHINKQYKLPKPNKSHYRRTVFYLGLKLYNKLPPEIKSIVSINRYKLQLKHHILLHPEHYGSID